MNGQCVNRMRHEIGESIIHQPMTSDWRFAPEDLGANVHAIVTRATLRTGMAGVQVRLVLDAQIERVEAGQAFGHECDA